MNPRPSISKGNCTYYVFGVYFLNTQCNTVPGLRGTEIHSSLSTHKQRYTSDWMIIF